MQRSQELIAAKPAKKWEDMPRKRTSRCGEFKSRLVIRGEYLDGRQVGGSVSLVSDERSVAIWRESDHAARSTLRRWDQAAGAADATHKPRSIGRVG